jgi:hypothetical protein
MSGKVQIFGGGGASFAPGVVSAFTANTIPYINGSQVVSQDVNLTYQSSQLGVGISSSLGAKIHIKGDNDSSGSAFKVQSATYEILNIYNNRQVVMGSGSAIASTDYTLRGFSSTGGGGYAFNIGNINGNNAIRIHNSDGTNGGVEIYRQNLSSNNALSIFGGTTRTLVFKSVGSFFFPYANPISDLTADTSGPVIGYSNEASYPGFSIIAPSRETVLFYTIGGLNNNGSKLRMSGAMGTADPVPFASMLRIDPTYNWTSGAANIACLYYKPTITSLSGGVNYGVIMDSGLSGFNMGGALPVANVHVGAGTTGIPQMKFESSAAPTGGALTNGTFWYDGTDLKFRTGGVTRTVTLA